MPDAAGGGYHFEDAHGSSGSGNLHCISLHPLGPAKIPPRQWAYGRFLLFGSAAVIGAVDGGGKGAIAVAMALSMITGEPLLGERVWRTGQVAIVTYEDDREEWHRRIAAACIHYSLDYESVLANVHFIERTDRRVCFAALTDGTTIFPDGKEITNILVGMGAVLLIVDPLNHAHDFDDGNNNVQVAKVAAEMSRVAHEARCAVLVLHHLRKGSSGQTDDLMGATSLRATFRSARILARMTPEQAELLKITDGAWRYIRIAGTKENYAPPPDKATWFRLIGVPLGNTDDATYPEGDDVGVATTWKPRPMFEGMDAPILRAVFDALRQTVHGPNRQAKHTPWCGTPLMAIGGRSAQEATKIIKAWLESGVLVQGEYYHLPTRHNVANVTLDEAKVSSILAELEALNAPVE